jgi:serine/threonine protein kinase
MRAQVLNEHGALPLALARALTRQLMQALVVLHSFGVAHRDVKPENLMVNFTDDAPSLIDPASVQATRARAPLSLSPCQAPR